MKETKARIRTVLTMMITGDSANDDANIVMSCHAMSSKLDKIHLEKLMITYN